MERSASDPRLEYASDADADGADPDAQRYDRGPDPVAFARGQIALAVDAWSRLGEDSLASAAELGERYWAGYFAYRSGIKAALPVIGGVRSSRQLSGPVYRAVSAQEQREALEFLDTHVFSSNAFDLPPEVVQRIGRDRRAGYAPDSPLAPAEIGASLQSDALASIFEPARLSRLANRSALADPADGFGLDDVVSAVRESIWRELSSQVQPVSASRRGLQREHVSLLIGLLMDRDGRPTPPSEIRAMARAELKSLGNRVKTALDSPKLDRTTREHLEDLQVTIDAAANPRNAS